VNSEELELSLRTEFESYLKTVIAEMRQEVSDFQKTVEAEVDKHKSQMDEAFQSFQDRFASDKDLNIAFTETVVEHLRLARDEGARITATAIAEAEDLDREQAAATEPSHVVSDIRDATREISGKTTQSAILKSLVSHASKFTPRGAFFIIKNEHLVGWRVFGTEAKTDDKTVREVFFPTTSETLIGEAVRELTTIEGAYGTFQDDNAFLSGLGFGQPDRMYAIPLIVRERAVAVLYADYGNEGINVNVEALETLVQVAGLTVEISASARSAKAQTEPEIQNEDTHEDIHTEATAGLESEELSAAEAPTAVEQPETAFESSYFLDEASKTEMAESIETVEAVEDEGQTVSETFESTETYEISESDASKSITAEFESETSFEYAPEIEEPVAEFESETSFEYAPEIEEPVAEFESETSFEYAPEVEEPVAEFEPTVEWNASLPSSDEFESFPATSFEPSEEPVELDPSIPVAEFEYESVPAASNLDFETAPQSFETPEFERAQSFESPIFNVEPVVEAAPELTVPEVSKIRPRLSERNVDLPIEVSEDERRLHNDARRFARLLVSEIKLYNEQKVKEGRDANDLYEKLREAIDRSREMYDKRVQPPVAAKFDYFHYELVSNLAEGDETKLGTTYPGTSN
jgi:hypothetical protein